MPTLVDLCNRALIHVGTRTRIASLGEASQEARTLNDLYEGVLDELLSSARWGFARKTAVLTIHKQVSGSGTGPWDNTTPPPPWAYSYLLPDDCIRVRYILPVAENIYPSVPIFPDNIGVTGQFVNGTAIPFVMASDTDGADDIQVLLTNHPSAIVVYTARIEDPNAWTPAFRAAFEYALAEASVIQLTGDRPKHLDLQKLAVNRLAEAQAQDANDGLSLWDQVPESLRVRGFNDFGGYVP